MSLRTLNRWLAWLEAAGWIRRVRRPHLAPDGKWKFHSTLYELAGKVWTWAKKQATKLRKFFTVFGLPQMAEYNLKPQRVILGGDSLNAAFPPQLGEKGAPSATRLSDEDRQANILRLGRLVATVFKN
jgi:hypothetical protein